MWKHLTWGHLTHLTLPSLCADRVVTFLIDTNNKCHCDNKDFGREEGWDFLLGFLCSCLLCLYTDNRQKPLGWKSRKKAGPTTLRDGAASYLVHCDKEGQCSHALDSCKSKKKPSAKPICKVSSNRKEKKTNLATSRGY